MQDFYTCNCGNQTWIIMENQVQCTGCEAKYGSLHTPVKDFNRMIAEEIKELEEAKLFLDEFMCTEEIRARDDVPRPA